MNDKPKVNIDLLDIDMKTGAYWLHPSQKNLGKRDPKLEAIRKKNRDKYLAKRKRGGK